MFSEPHTCPCSSFISQSGPLSSSTPVPHSLISLVCLSAFVHSFSSVKGRCLTPICPASPVFASRLAGGAGTQTVGFSKAVKQTASHTSLDKFVRVSNKSDDSFAGTSGSSSHLLRGTCLSPPIGTFSFIYISFGLISQ